MADVAVEAAQKGRVARHEEGERPAWLEQRVDGFHCSLVVGDVLEDVDTERRVEAVAAQRVDRLSQVMTADHDVGTIVKAVAGRPDIVVDHVDPDDQLAINHEAGDRTGAATDLEDALAQAAPDPIVDPAVVSVGAFHDFECRRSGWQVHVASLQMQTPPSWRGGVPVSHVKNAIIRSRSGIGPTIMASTFQASRSRRTWPRRSSLRAGGSSPCSIILITLLVWVGGLLKEGPGSSAYASGMRKRISAPACQNMAELFASRAYGSTKATVPCGSCFTPLPAKKRGTSTGSAGNGSRGMSGSRAAPITRALNSFDKPPALAVEDTVGAASHASAA